MSSVREGLPNALLEAMALEVPVVATRIAGIPRLISDSEDGLLVEANNIAALTASMERALASSTLRKQLARSGRQTIEDRYSFGARMRKVAAIYDDLLGRANGASRMP
jgi:glycosyltransferase involved in cell wall biosynthesis